MSEMPDASGSRVHPSISLILRDAVDDLVAAMVILRDKQNARERGPDIDTDPEQERVCIEARTAYATYLRVAGRGDQNVQQASTEFLIQRLSQATELLDENTLYFGAVNEWLNELRERKIEADD